MLSNSYREQATWVGVAVSALVIGLGLAALGASLNLGPLVLGGSLMLVAGVVVLLWRLWRLLLVLGLVALAGATLVGLLRNAAYLAVKPAVGSLAIVIPVVAGALFASRFRQIAMQMLSPLRRFAPGGRRASRRPSPDALDRNPRGALPTPPRLRVRPASPRTLSMRPQPLTDRRCRVCGRMVLATQDTCPHCSPEARRS